MNAAGGVRFVFARFAGADASRAALAREPCARIILRVPFAFERPLAFAVILRAPFALDFAPRFACVLRLDFDFAFTFDRAFATAVSSES
jgi:hypothetical protein